jgi:colanic acid/amylovoran biosynthesis glycosyltransferase
MKEGIRIAYLVNIYPKGSHTFIRREILELERQGVAVARYALRGWDSDLADSLDQEELLKTRHTLRAGLLPLLGCAARVAWNRPRLFFKALRRGLAMAKNGERSWPYHLVYLAHAAQIYEWLEGSGVTHVHAHFGSNSAEVAALLRMLGGPTYSFIVHGAEVLDNPAQHALPLKMKDAQFALGSCAYAASQMMYQVDPDLWPRIKVVHCGLPRAAFENPATPLPEYPVFLSIGRFSSEKGHIILLRAFAAVIATHPKSRLVLVGDGPIRAKLEEQVEELNLGHAVKFKGWLDSVEVQDQIRQASTLVHPSFSEGLPVVIMEAMAERRPVISTYIAGIPELVKDGETGWLVPAGQEADLAAAMNACAATNKHDLSRMGEAGFERVLARHHIQTEVAKLIELFSAEGRS